MKTQLTFDFCEMFVYDRYLVVIVNEGVAIVPSHNDVLVKVTNNHFLDQPFVYITHRINSYSVDPQIYFETSKIKNLKGFAVVSSNYKAKVNAKIEQLFFKKPFQIFTEMEDAVDWVDELLKNDI